MTAKRYETRHNSTRTGAHNTAPLLRRGRGAVTPRANQESKNQRKAGR